MADEEKYGYRVGEKAEAPEAQPKGDTWGAIPQQPHPETHGDKAVARISAFYLGFRSGTIFTKELRSSQSLDLTGCISLSGLLALDWSRVAGDQGRAPAMVQQQIPSLARNPLAWLAIVLAMFFYGVGPEMYRPRPRHWRRKRLAN
jgi:hypothetical protein